MAMSHCRHEGRSVLLVLNSQIGMVSLDDILEDGKIASCRCKVYARFVFGVKDCVHEFLERVYLSKELVAVRGCLFLQLGEIHLEVGEGQLGKRA